MKEIKTIEYTLLSHSLVITDRYSLGIVRSLAKSATVYSGHARVFIDRKDSFCLMALCWLVRNEFGAGRQRVLSVSECMSVRTTSE